MRISTKNVLKILLYHTHTHKLQTYRARSVLNPWANLCVFLLSLPLSLSLSLSLSFSLSLPVPLSRSLHSIVGDFAKFKSSQSFLEVESFRQDFLEDIQPERSKSCAEGTKCVFMSNLHSSRLFEYMIRNDFQ